MAVKVCPDRLLGDPEVLEKKLAVKYSGRKLKEAVEFCRKRNVFIYSAVLSVFLIIAGILFLLSLADADAVSIIQRPENGQGQKTIPMIVEAEKDGTSVKGPVNIIVREEKLSDEEKDRVLEEYAEKLPDLICPETEGQRIVTETFSLPAADEGRGILMDWESSDPVLISEEGRYDVLELAQEEETVTLTAYLTYGGREKKVSFDVVLRRDPALYQKSVIRRIEAMTDEISVGEDGSSVTLPSQIGEDIRLRWKKYDTDSAGILAAGGVIAAVFFIFRKYAFAEREVDRYCRGIVKNFPPFIDKLVLLLNSGMTVLTAMEKAADDCRLQAEYDRENTLAREAAEIGRKVREMNASVVREWHSFAVRTGISEVMRFSAMIEDNIGKGDALAEKLETEGNLLRDKEKKQVQEKMRMIDSKLTLPLILMLFSLVLVTVAPAMMQM